MVVDVNREELGSQGGVREQPVRLYEVIGEVGAVVGLAEPTVGCHVQQVEESPQIIHGGLSTARKGGRRRGRSNGMAASWECLGLTGSVWARLGVSGPDWERARELRRRQGDGQGGVCPTWSLKETRATAQHLMIDRVTCSRSENMDVYRL